MVGKVTADLPDPAYDVLSVYFGPGQWNTYYPNRWSKDNLFDVVDDAGPVDADQ